MLCKSVLVTGCGGDIGQGIGRILKQDHVAETVVGTDIHAYHPAAILFDHFEIVPKVSDPLYFEQLSHLINKYGIQLIILTSEAEIRAFFDRDMVDYFNGIPILLPNKNSLNIGLDKLKTARFLEKSGLPFPLTDIAGLSLPPQFPCILKSRFGSGSKDVRVVHENEKHTLISGYDDFIWQELLLPHDEEYTCGLYRTRTEKVRTIIFKRILGGDRTRYGEVVRNSAIEKLLADLANALDLQGSINVQLRLTSKGPVIFEINPRFSSTVMFRHKLGFQDVIWAISEKLGLEPESYQGAAVGTKFFRGDYEYFW